MDQVINSKKIKIIRDGYGNIHNDIYVDEFYFYKYPKTNIGKIKLNDEINFYHFLASHEINFPTPKIRTMITNELIQMENINCATKLCDYLVNTRNFNILDKIDLYLSELQKNFILISKYQYYKLLRQETVEKILKRGTDILHLINKYKITHVNNLKIYSHEEIIKKISLHIEKLVTGDNTAVKKLYLIHGDLNFGNVLIDSKNNKIFFIDPRGYFGDSKLFGIKEYDNAKIKFSLSGYDVLDGCDDIKYLISEHSINIDIFPLKDINKIITNDLETFLMITIWLANPHCYINNENKCVSSYFYGLYCATKFFNLI